MLLLLVGVHAPRLLLLLPLCLSLWRPWLLLKLLLLKLLLLKVWLASQWSVLSRLVVTQALQLLLPLLVCGFRSTLWLLLLLLQLLLQHLVIQPRHCCQRLNQPLLLHCLQPWPLPLPSPWLTHNRIWGGLTSSSSCSHQASRNVAVPQLPEARQAGGSWCSSTAVETWLLLLLLL